VAFHSIRETLDGKSSADLSTADSAIPQFQRFIGPNRKIHIEAKEIDDSIESFS